MPVDRICWNCDYFQAAEIETTRAGWCRRSAPNGLDYKSIPAPVEPYEMFAGIKDATLEQCGEFKTNAAGSPPLP